MLTLNIQLKNRSGEKQHHYIESNIPGGADIARITAEDATGLVQIDLDQGKLTEAQRDWLNMSSYAAYYIDEYQVIQPENDVEKLAKENERLQAQLNKAYQLLSNMPVDTTEQDSMTLLWIAERDKWLHEQIVEASNV